MAQVWHGRNEIDFLGDFSRWWDNWIRRSIEATEKYFGQIDRDARETDVLYVRYEDLRSNPEQCLTEVF